MLSDYFAQRKIPFLTLGSELRLPAQFSTFEKEYWAVRKSAGIFDFSFMSTVEVTGSDAIALFRLVQNRNCEELPIGKIAYSLLLNKNGDVWLDATIWRLDQHHFYLITGYSILAFLQEAAKDFKELQMQDISAQYQVIAVQGPQSKNVLQAVLGIAADDLPNNFAFMHPPKFPHLTIARLGYTGELGYELLVQPAEAIGLWKQLQDSTNFPALECGFLAADILRIEAGFILFCNELKRPRSPISLDKNGSTSQTAKPILGIEMLVGLRFKHGAKTEINRADLDLNIHVTSRAFSPRLGCEIGLGFISSINLSKPSLGVVGSAPEASIHIERLPFYPSKQGS
jgi:glycine cleavage system aminomethyltransferase T